MITVGVVVISMVISVLAAFSLAKDRVLGSQTLATVKFDLPDPGVAAVPAVVPDHRLAGPDQLGLVPADPLSDAGGAVLHLDHDRLLQLDPEGTR